jgi:hypothetical protein
MDIGYKDVVPRDGSKKLFWTGYLSLIINSYVRTVLYNYPGQVTDVWDDTSPFYSWNIEGKYNGVWL